MDEAVERDSDSGTNRIYAQQDANWNVTSLVAKVSNVWQVVERFVYDPYGSPTVLTSAWVSTTDSYNWVYMFQGGRYDSVAGLYNFRNRDLNPGLGVWMEKDPARYIGGANLYLADCSNPVVRRDPLGLSSNVKELAQQFEEAQNQFSGQATLLHNLLKTMAQTCAIPPSPFETCYSDYKALIQSALGGLYHEAFGGAQSELGVLDGLMAFAGLASDTTDLLGSVGVLTGAEIGEAVARISGVIAALPSLYDAVQDWSESRFQSAGDIVAGIISADAPFEGIPIVDIAAALYGIGRVAISQIPVTAQNQEDCKVCEMAADAYWFVSKRAWNARNDMVGAAIRLRFAAGL